MSDTTAPPDLNTQLSQVISQLTGQTSAPPLAAPQQFQRDPNLSITGLLGSALGGGFSGAIPMTPQEQQSAGNRALLNFGINMLAASGNQPGVRRSFNTILAQGLGGAGESLGGSEAVAAAQQAAQQEYQQQALQNRMEMLKAAMPLLQYQMAQQGAQRASAALGGGGGAATPGGQPGDFNSFIISSEGPPTQSKTSSAAGYGQFLGGIDKSGNLTGTWGDFAAANPTLFAGMSPQQILDARNNPAIANQAITWLANNNAASLTNAGVRPDGMSLGIAHRLGAGAAAKVMQASDNTPIASLVSQAALDANSDLKNMTVGQMKARYASAPNPSFLQPYQTASTGPVPPPTRPSPVTPAVAAPSPPAAAAPALLSPAPGAPVPIQPLPEDAARAMARLRGQLVPIAVEGTNRASGLWAKPDGGLTPQGPTAAPTPPPALPPTPAGPAAPVVPPAVPAVVGGPPAAAVAGPGAPPGPVAAPAPPPAAAAPAKAAPSIANPSADTVTLGDVTINHPGDPAAYYAAHRSPVPTGGIYDPSITPQDAQALARQKAVADAETDPVKQIGLYQQLAADQAKAQADATNRALKAQQDFEAKDRETVMGQYNTDLKTFTDAQSKKMAFNTDGLNQERQEEIKNNSSLISSFQGDAVRATQALAAIKQAQKLIPMLPEGGSAILDSPVLRTALGQLNTALGGAQPDWDVHATGADLWNQAIQAIVGQMGIGGQGGQPGGRGSAYDQYEKLMPGLLGSNSGREMSLILLQELANRQQQEPQFLDNYKNKSENINQRLGVPDMSGALPAMNDYFNQRSLQLPPPSYDPNSPPVKDPNSQEAKDRKATGDAYIDYFRGLQPGQRYIGYTIDRQGRAHPEARTFNGETSPFTPYKPGTQPGS